MTSIKILIVVDVQNNLLDSINLEYNKEFSYYLDDLINEQITNIEELIDENKLNIFTRDFHFLNTTSIYPTSIKNNLKNKILNRKLLGKNNTISSNYRKFIQNTKPKILNTITKEYDLSYFLLLTKYILEIYTLIKDVKQNHTIGIKQYSDLSTPNINNIKTQVEEINYNTCNTKQFIQLNKGEFLESKSFSAFNYHTNNDSKLNSTGLFEYIINYSKINNINRFNITVCGLFGNICIIHTIFQGLNFWNRYYKKDNPTINIKFIYNTSGTLFLPFYPIRKNFIIICKTIFDDITILNFYNYFDTLLPNGYTINKDNEFSNILLAKGYTHLYFFVCYKQNNMFKYTTDRGVGTKYYEVFHRINYKSKSDIVQTIAPDLYKYNKYKQKYLNLYKFI